MRGDPLAQHDGAMETIHRSFARARLIRNTDDRILGGVCSGLAARFGIDAWALRLLVLLTLIVIPGSQILLYPAAWILMPDENRASAVLRTLPGSPVKVAETSA